MGYALLIVEPAGQREERTEAEGRELYDRMLKFSADLKARSSSLFRSRSHRTKPARAFASREIDTPSSMGHSRSRRR